MKRVISSTKQSSLYDACRTLQQLSYAVEDLRPEDSKQFEEITGLKVADISEAYMMLHHDLYPVAE